MFAPSIIENAQKFKRKEKEAQELLNSLFIREADGTCVALRPEITKEQERAMVPVLKSLIEEFTILRDSFKTLNETASDLEEKAEMMRPEMEAHERKYGVPFVGWIRKAFGLTGA